MSQIGYPTAPESWTNLTEHLRKIARTANLGLGGKLNAVTQVTLTPGSTTTTVTDSRIGANTFFGFQPLTADAAAAAGGLYVSAQANGTATLSHANASSVDRTFRILLIG